MKDRRQQILRKALELYLERGYAGVSISVLQEELGIGRATMYYYFKDKEELFRTIVTHYYLEPLNQSISMPDDITLPVLIKSRKDLYLERREFFATFHNVHITAYNLQSLLLYATIHFPDIGHTVGEMKKQETQLWRRALLNSIQKDEVRRNIEPDNLALAFSGLKEMGDLSVFVKVEYGERYINAMNYLFDLIKN